MSYLSEQDIIDKQKSVILVSVKYIENRSHILFDSEIEEYSEFLLIAYKFFDLNVSKTFLLLHKKTNELLAYMTL